MRQLQGPEPRFGPSSWGAGFGPKLGRGPRAWAGASRGLRQAHRGLGPGPQGLVARAPERLGPRPKTEPLLATGEGVGVS